MKPPTRYKSKRCIVRLYTSNEIGGSRVRIADQLNVEWPVQASRVNSGERRCLYTTIKEGA